MPIASVEIKSIAEDYTTALVLRFFRGRGNRRFERNLLIAGSAGALARKAGEAADSCGFLVVDLMLNPNM